MMRWLFLLIGLGLAIPGFSQEIRFTDSCWTLLQKAGLANEFGEYESALHLCDSSLRGCKSKLVLTGAYTGKARALNGLKRYPEAIAAADAALSLAKNSSIAALAERAEAHFSAHQDPAGIKDYNTLDHRLQQSTKPREKAFILAKLANLNWLRGNRSLAMKQVNKSISLDPPSASYYQQLGDYKVLDNKIPEALQCFEKAAANHGNEQLLAWKKARAFSLSMQQKYRLHDAKELKIKLRIDEKLAYCEYWKAAFNAGYTNKQDELNFSFICQ